LLGGYYYAHLLIVHLSPKIRALVHGIVIIGCLLFLQLDPVQPDIERLKGDPVLSILLLLARHVAWPYFILSASAPLIHFLFFQRYTKASAYRLYALSNIGSFVALLTYPVFVEPRWALEGQFSVWSSLFIVYCCALGFLIVTAFGLQRQRANEHQVADPQWTTSRKSLSFLLAFCGTALLLSISNHLCYDIAAVPFLWILPLSLYLLSFILTFDSPRWYRPKFYTPASIFLMLIFTQGYLTGPAVSIILATALCLLTLFSTCMTCHGELYRLRPHGTAASSFYLTMSAGGAAGGVFVALVAPRIFTAYYEVAVTFVVVFVALIVIHFCFSDSRYPYSSHQKMFRYALLSLVGYGFAVSLNTYLSASANIEQRRNFYGVLRVHEDLSGDDSQHQRLQTHGRIVHGSQFLQPEKSLIATEYYSKLSGVARLFHSMDSPRRSGLIGLGAGTLAVYGNQGDVMRFYEINPIVIEQAKKYFSFLERSLAKIEIIEGDARLTLGAEAPQQFDILVIDAFSGDSIPTHLVTREAFELYLTHLSSRGVIALNISNRHLDLKPVLNAVAGEFNLRVALVDSGENEDLGAVPAEWYLMSTAKKLPKIHGAKWLDSGQLSGKKSLWTDRFSNLWSVIK
jgi:hypothetical protein